MQNTPCVCVHFQEQKETVLHNQVKWSISGSLKWTQYYSTTIQTVSTVPVSSTATFLISSWSRVLGMPLGFHFLLVFEHFLSFFFFHDINILKTSGQLFCIIPLRVCLLRFLKMRFILKSQRVGLSLTVHKWNLITNTPQFFFSFNFFQSSPRAVSIVKLFHWTALAKMGFFQVRSHFLWLAAT